VAVAAELLGPHGGADTAQAARLLTRGALSGRFWSRVAVGGVLAFLKAIIYLPARVLGEKPA